MKGTKVQILVALAELYSAHAMEQITFNVYKYAKYRRVHFFGIPASI